MQTYSTQQIKKLKIAWLPALEHEIQHFLSSEQEEPYFQNKIVQRATLIQNILKHDQEWEYYELFDKIYHDLVFWENPQTFWHEATKLDITKPIFLNFFTSEPLVLNIKNHPVHLYGAIIYRKDNQTHFLPLGSTEQLPGLLHPQPIICSEQKVEEKSKLFVYRTPQDSDMDLLSNPTLPMLSRWLGLGLTQFLISFLYTGSTVLYDNQLGALPDME